MGNDNSASLPTFAVSSSAACAFFDFLAGRPRLDLVGSLAGVDRWCGSAMTVRRISALSSGVPWYMQTGI